MTHTHTRTHTKFVRSRALVPIVCCLFHAIIFAACRSKIEVKTIQGAKVEPMQVLARYPVVVTAGDQVELRGLGFRSNLALSLLDQSDSVSAQTLSVTVDSAETARFIVPQLAKPGIYQLNASQDRQSQVLSLVFTADMLESAVFTSDAQNICVGQKFYDLGGNLREGSKVCEANSNNNRCSKDGEFDCLATADLPAVVKQNLASKVIVGATVAGVAGAIKMPEASQVIKSVEFGINQLGTVTIPAASDVRQGVTFGFNSTLIGQLSAGSATLLECSSDGATNCVAVSNYPAVDKINKLVGGNIKSGVSIAGVVGTYPSAQHPLTGAESAVADLPNFTATLGGAIYEWFQSDGTRLSDSIQADAMLTPTAAQQTLTAGLYRSVAVAGDSDLVSQKILSGVDIFGVVGNVFPKPIDCASDGATGCVSVATYPAVKRANFIASDVKTGRTIAGVPGSLNDCSADGSTSCVAALPFRAALTIQLAAKVVSGNTVAGIAGTSVIPAASSVLSGVSVGVGDTGNVVLPGVSDVRTGVTFGSNSLSTGELDPGAGVPASCSADNQVNCVANTNYPAAKLAGFLGADLKSGRTVAGVAGTLDDCSTDGSSSCVATSTYRAALTTGLGPKVLSGNTVAGIAGSATAESHSDCAADGGTGCVAISTFPAARLANFLASDVKTGKTVAGVVGSLNNCSADGSSSCVATPTYTAALTTGLGPKVLSGNTVGGVAGSAIAESHSNCATDGSTGCVTVAGFKAADMTRAVASNIKSGSTIAGVIGSYPSLSYPLAGADSTTDLDFATFDARIKSAATFEWFDSSGTRYTNTGDADIVTGNIANGVTIFGTTGTLASGSNCTADGQTSCVTTSRYKSMDTDPSVISTWDIRKGKMAGGLAGEIVFYKNMANTAVFNRTTGTSALAGVDFYDTIEDYNNGVFPTQNPTGWDQATGANWLRDSVSDTGAGGGVASDGICNGSEICVYTDRITGLYWLRDDATIRTWENAISYCEDSTIGGYSDWRLPTQKELMQAYIDGVWSQKDATRLNLTAGYNYWSSSTPSDFPTNAIFVYLINGANDISPKTVPDRVLCVR